MSYDKPDWYQYRARGPLYPLTDMGELAARLGSIDTFDRRGDVIWMDDFEHGLAAWKPEPTGAGTFPVISAESAFRGNFSAKLTAPAAGAGYAAFYRYSPYPAVSRFGLEMAFTTASNMERQTFEISINTGTTRYWFVAIYHSYNNTLSCFVPPGVFQVFATGVKLMADPKCFNIIKIVADLSTLKYMRCLLNEATYDLSAYSPYLHDEVINPYLWVYHEGYSNVAAAKVYHIDSVILTQNEP